MKYDKFVSAIDEQPTFTPQLLELANASEMQNETSSSTLNFNNDKKINISSAYMICDEDVEQSSMIVEELNTLSTLNLNNDSSINISSASMICDEDVEQSSMIVEETNTEKSLFSNSNTYPDGFPFIQNNINGYYLINNSFMTLQHTNQLRNISAMKSLMHFFSACNVKLNVKILIY